MTKQEIKQMMAMINRIGKKTQYLGLICVLSLMGHSKVNSQQLGGRYGAAIDFDLKKSFSFSTTFEVRNSFDYVFQVEQFFPEFSLGYKINKHFDVSANYRLLMSKEDNDFYYLRNKMYLNLSADFSADRFTFKNRARYQVQTRTYIENETDLIPDQYVRNKFEISYNINNNPIDPFVSFEAYYPINAYKTNTIDEYRISGGLDFPVGKDQDMEIGIMFNTERFPVPEKALILLVSYSFSVD